MAGAFLRVMAAVLLIAGMATAQAPAVKDWPQYRGPNRDGISKETGLLKTWPATGPKALWKAPIGEAYSGIAISGGRLFTMDSSGKEESIVCLDAATGKTIWRYKVGPLFSNDQGSGPRSTPTIDGEWLYTASPAGMLVALSVKDGKKIWSHDLVKEYDSEIPQWGTSVSPLVEKELLIMDVGGKKDYSVVAFNKKDGSVVWHTHTDSQGYSSPVAVTIGGVRQILVFTGTSLVSIAPDGKLLWKYPWRTSYNANIATPVFIPPDKIFISTSYDTGAAVVQVKGNSVQEVWKSRVMKNHFNSSIYYGGSIYGFDDATFKSINAQTGQEQWKDRGYGKGSLILADGKLIVLSERGLLSLVEASPAAFKEISNFMVLQGKTWTMPSLADGKLYVRSQKEIVCLDLRAQ